VDGWFPYITVENEERVLPALADALEFRYPLVRELSGCRSRSDVLHTLKWWWSFVRSRRRRPLVKEPHAVFSAPWFSSRLGSDVVVTVRHPAAVVASWKRLGWSFDFNNLLTQPALLRDWLEPFETEMRAALEPPADLVDRVALLWHVIYDVVGEHRKRFPEFHVVRQEDLSRNPTDEFRRLYGQLRVPFTSDVEHTVASASSRDNPKETQVESPHETRLDSIANLGSWRTRLSPEELNRIRRRTERTAGLFYTEDDW
jgi:hypothetical protein